MALPTYQSTFHHTATGMDIGEAHQIHPLIVFNIPSTDTQGTGIASKAHAIAGSWLLLWYSELCVLSNGGLPHLLG